MTDDIDNLKQHKFDTSEYKTVAPRPCCKDRDNLKAQLEEAKRGIAKAALCILENPHGAISDTIWLSENSLGGTTLYEHLIGYLDIDLPGLPDDEHVIRAWLEGKPNER